MPTSGSIAQSLQCWLAVYAAAKCFTHKAQQQPQGTAATATTRHSSNNTNSCRQEPQLSTGVPARVHAMVTLNPAQEALLLGAQHSYCLQTMPAGAIHQAHQLVLPHNITRPSWVHALLQTLLLLAHVACPAAAAVLSPHLACPPV